VTEHNQPQSWTGAKDVPEDDPVEFQGPTRDRKCTDVICLILFLVFIAAWAIVAFYAAVNGDINRVIYPTDSQGRICGAGDLKDRPKLLFFDLTKCLNFGVMAHGCVTPQVCVKECPQKASSGYALAKKGQNALAKVTMRPYCSQMTDEEWDSKTAMNLINAKLCPTWVLPSTAILGRCLPLGNMAGKDKNETIVTPDEAEDGKGVTAGTVTKAVSRLGAFLGLREFVEKVGNDLADTYWMIGVALIGSTVTSFIWIILMRFFTGIMVWASIFLLFAVAGSTLAYSIYRYRWIIDHVNLEDSSKNIFEVDFTPEYFQEVLMLKDTWLAFIVILSIILGIILLILIALRQRIQIAIKLIEQGSKAVSSMLSTLFFPVVPFALHLFVIGSAMTIAVLLSSVRSPNNTIYYKSADTDATSNVTQPPLGCDVGSCVNPDTNATYLFNDTCNMKDFAKRGCDTGCQEEVLCRFVSYSPNSDSVWMPWFNLFGFFWGMAFVSAFAEMVLAHAFATWYWTWDKKDVPFFTLTLAMFNTTVFHLGTIAFGSLIIAIIKFIRAILDYVEKKLSMYNNDLTRCLLWCCKCCLWCLEKFMRFINRNAYIVCAIRSSNFCSSAKHAFDLLIRNLVRVVVLNSVVNFLLFLGKLVIMAGAATLSYLVFSNQYFPELHDNVPTLNYFVTPVIAIVIGTYFITSSFFGVYEMAVDTLFLCFLEDLDRNDGTPSKPYFMSKGLLNVVGKMNEMQMRNTKEEEQ